MKIQAWVRANVAQNDYRKLSKCFFYLLLSHLLEIIKKGGLRQDIKDLYSFYTYCLTHAVVHILAYHYILDKYRFQRGPCKIFPLEGKFLAYEIQTIASYEFCLYFYFRDTITEKSMIKK